MVLLLHATNLAFAKIPVGGHTVCACVAASAIVVLFSFLSRLFVESIVPFEVVITGILALIFMDILYGMIKFIPVKDERTGQTKRWAIGTWCSSAKRENLNHPLLYVITRLSITVLHFYHSFSS